MFIGHYAVGFAAKKIYPKISLGTYFLAAVWADLAWAILTFLGVEHAEISPGITKLFPIDLVFMPYSHSLLAGIIWAGIFGVIYFLSKSNLKGALALGVCVLSHWVLDFITHKPDMPLTLSGEDRVGLSLWNSIFGTLVVEFGFFIFAIAIYLQAKLILKIRHEFWIFVSILLFIYSGQYGGFVPPSIQVASMLVFAQVLFVFLGYYIDRPLKDLQDSARF